ncbi:MAG TPA: FliH/SctL family protein [Oligoflexia bacterium]|nr:FliH/SctL family protein [Oligoflexia bacterium]HMP27516.1 FliH/SctL family protein [Oligoflexia bacterium]
MDQASTLKKQENLDERFEPKIKAQFIPLQIKESNLLSSAVDLYKQTFTECQKQLKQTRQKLALHIIKTRKQARQRARAELARLADKEQRALQVAAFEMYAEVINQSSEKIAEIALAISEKILREELKKRPEKLAEEIRAAIERFHPERVIAVVVNPKQQNEIENHLSGLRSNLSSSTPLKIISDPTIQLGDALIRSNAGEVRFELKQEINSHKDQLTTLLC